MVCDGYDLEKSARTGKINGFSRASAREGLNEDALAQAHLSSCLIDFEINTVQMFTKMQNL